MDAHRQPPRVRDGVRVALPLAPGPVLFGLSFGVLAEAAGMGAAAAVVMSATTFAGSAQFAAASVLEDGGTALAAALSAVLLNARYVGMSVAVASVVPGGRIRRFFSSQLIVDESWALSGRSGRFEWPILAGAGLLLYALWVTSTLPRNSRGRAARRPERPRAGRGVRSTLPRPAAPVPEEPASTPGGSRRRSDHTRVAARRSPGPAARRGLGGVPPRAQAVGAVSPSTTEVWVVVAVVGVVTLVFKAAGPVFLGRRALPERVDAVVQLIAPVMLTALVVTQTFGSGDGISVDARVPGVAAAAVALLRGVPIIAAMVLAAAVTALFRLAV